MNLEKGLKRNIHTDYIFCFLRNFDVSSAIWVLYMVYRGLPLWQIGLVEGIFHVASFLFEMPSGALADLVGRKKVMFWGRIFAAVSALVLLFSVELWQFILGFVLAALGYNLNSGSEEALVYDSLKQLHKEQEYVKVNGRMNVLIEIAAGAGTFLGGILAERSFAACYLAAAVVAGISVFPIFFLQEPPIREEREQRNLKLHFLETVQVLRENPGVMGILLYYPLVETFYTVTFFYGQQYFAEFGCSRMKISLLMLAAGIFSCLGALSSEGVLRILGEKTRYVISFLLGISIVAISKGGILIAIGAFLVASYANSLIYPIASAALNQKIPSRHRATIISVDSMCFSVMMLCFFPAVGGIATGYGLSTAFLILGVTELLLTLFIIKKKNA